MIVLFFQKVIRLDSDMIKHYEIISYELMFL